MRRVAFGFERPWLHQTIGDRGFLFQYDKLKAGSILQIEPDVSGQDIGFKPTPP